MLIEVPEADRGTGVAGALNHLGVEVEDVAAVEAAARRLRDAGLAAFDEKDTTCCYALQDKVPTQDVQFSTWDITKAVLVFLGTPLATGSLTRRWGLRAKGRTWYDEKFIPV